MGSALPDPLLLAVPAFLILIINGAWIAVLAGIGALIGGMFYVIRLA